MKTQNFISMVAGLAGLVACNLAFAESHQIELGSGNITPCSKVEWRQDDFGIPWPTTQFADQRVTAYAVIEAPTLPGIQNDVQQCAVQGAAAATLTSIFASPGGAMPAFQAQFESCMRDRASEYFSLQLQLSDGECQW